MNLPDNFKTVNCFNLTNRILQILLGVSFICGLNYLASRHYSRTDLTRNRLYSLSPETIAYISEIKTPVKIIVTIPPDSEEPSTTLLYRYVRNLLQEYENAGRDGTAKKIEVEFVDVFREFRKAEAISRSYGIENPNETLVVSGDKRRTILPADLLHSSEERTTTFWGEQAFTSAIIEVTDEKPDRVYFLVGHGEMQIDDVDPRRGLSQFAHELEMRSFKLKALDLSKEKQVPEDADLIISVSPQSPLTANESEALRRYLSDRAGRLIVFLDPWRNHGFDDLFYEWGILADKMLIVDNGPDFQVASGDLIIRQFADHPITDPHLKNRIPVIVGLSRPIRPDLDAPPDERRNTVSLIGSSPTSWAESSYQKAREIDNLQFDPIADLRGPVPIACSSERTVSSPFLSIAGGRLVVFGNSDFATNQRISSFGNHMLLLNTVKWCLDRDTLLAIRGRAVETYQMLISRKELNQLGLLISTVPSIIAVWGLVIYWTRRR